MANDNPDFDSTKLDNEVTAHFAKWKEALEDLKKALADETPQIDANYKRFTSAKGDKSRVLKEVDLAFEKASANVKRSKKALEDGEALLTGFNSHKVDHQPGRMCDDCTFFIGGSGVFSAIVKYNAQSVRDTSAKFEHIVTAVLEWVDKQPK
jgi:hypothetical protein